MSEMFAAIEELADKYETAEAKKYQFLNEVLADLALGPTEDMAVLQALWTCDSYRLNTTDNDFKTLIAQVEEYLRPMELGRDSLQD